MPVPIWIQHLFDIAPAVAPAVESTGAGTNWQTGLSAEDNSWRAIAPGVVTATGLPRVCAVSFDGTHRVMYTDDGIHWTAATASVEADWFAIAFGVVAGVGTWVAVATYGVVMHSIDCINWVNSGAGITGFDATWNITAGVVAGVTRFVVVEDSPGGPSANHYAKSDDGGATWSTGTTQSDGPKWAVSWGLVGGVGTYVAVGCQNDTNQGAIYSHDGINWLTSTTQITQGTYGSIYYRNMFFGGGRFVALSEELFVATSTDGDTWTMTPGIFGCTTMSAGYRKHGCFGNGLAVIAAENASPGGYHFLTSPDYLRWTHQADPRDDLVPTAICYSEELKMFIGVNTSGTAGTNSRAFYSGGI